MFHLMNKVSKLFYIYIYELNQLFLDTNGFNKDEFLQHLDLKRKHPVDKDEIEENVQMCKYDEVVDMFC